MLQVLFDCGDGLCLDLVGEGVAVDASGVVAGGSGRIFEAYGIVPAGARGTFFVGRAFEEYAESRGARTEAGGDA